MTSRSRDRQGTRLFQFALSGARPLCVAVLVIAALPVTCAQAADWPETESAPLRGSYSAPQAASPLRWDGINFGVHLGMSNMNTDFGNSSSSLIAYSLRNTTLQDEFQPSSWTTLPSNTTNGRQYGAFLGYAVQWDELVLGVDGAYNRPSSFE